MLRAAFAFLALVVLAASPAFAQSRPDIGSYTLLWSDEFNRTSPLLIADAPDSAANWYTKQAWGGGFGSSTFMGASSGVFVLGTKGGEQALEIKMRRNTAGNLESGLISSVFPDGTSRHPLGQRNVYAEARLWLPDPIAGIWPAFWGMELDRLTQPACNRGIAVELDALEHYGEPMPDRYSTVIHNWSWTCNGASDLSTFTRKLAGSNVLATGWHTYGAEISDEGVTFYFDGQPYWFSASTTSLFQQGQPLGEFLNSPMMWMVNFAAGGGWAIDPELGTTAKPASMFVDYFRLYSNEAAPPAQISITTQPANVTVTAGQPFTLSVVASGCTPLTYQWRKGGTNISATSASYSVTSAVSGDAGSYDVVVGGCASAVTSSAATVTVNSASGYQNTVTIPVSNLPTGIVTDVANDGWTPRGGGTTTVVSSTNYTSPSTAIKYIQTSSARFSAVQFDTATAAGSVKTWMRSGAVYARFGSDLQAVYMKLDAANPTTSLRVLELGTVTGLTEGSATAWPAVGTHTAISSMLLSNLSGYNSAATQADDFTFEFNGGTLTAFYKGTSVLTATTSLTRSGTVKLWGGAYRDTTYRY